MGISIIEAWNKVPIKKLKEITFVKAKEILGIIYSSKTGNTNLKWRQIRKKNGKILGEASPNALVNLTETGVLTKDAMEHYLKKDLNKVIYN